MAFRLIQNSANPKAATRLQKEIDKYLDASGFAVGALSGAGTSYFSGTPETAITDRRLIGNWSGFNFPPYLTEKTKLTI